MELTLNAVIVILIIAIILFLSLYMVALYNRIICYQNNLNLKFEPIDLSIKKYASIMGKLLNCLSDGEELSALSTLKDKLSRVKNNNKKILLLKESNLFLNGLFDKYKSDDAVNKIKMEYELYYNKVEYAKDIYDKKVVEYNRYLYKFPNIILTKVFAFEKMNTIGE